jgi:hypothetical protein
MPKLSDNGAVLLPVPPAFATALAKPNKGPICPSYSKEAPMSEAAMASGGRPSSTPVVRDDARAAWLD